jgi:HEAT repeat protein
VRNAVTLLGAAGGEDVLDRLGAAARHSSDEVRREAARALVLAGGAAAIPHLSDLARDGSQDVARLAVSALAALMAPEAASALVDVARTAPDRTLRIQAIDELAGRPDASRFLPELLNSDRPRLPWRLRRYVRGLFRERGGAA